MDDVAFAGLAIAGISNLHRAKDGAYGDAWKRRGETIGVLANIARKVDRLENIARGGVATRDETVIDTAIDLFVYCVKYLAYLADQSTIIDAQLFDDSAGRGTRSSGTDGPDILFRRYREVKASTAGSEEVAAQVITAFNSLEACFSSTGWSSVEQRYENASRLTMAAWQYVLALGAESPSAMRDFVAAWSDER